MATDQISQECGRKIMGDNMFGAKEVVLHLDLNRVRIF